MPYFNGKEKFWEKVHHHLFGGVGTRRQVDTGHSTINQSKIYPDTFYDEFSCFQRILEQDRSFQSILTTLVDRDISRRGIKGFHDEGNFRVSIPKWYYPYRVRQLAHKYCLRLHA